jgi:hypothetical protein
LTRTRNAHLLADFAPYRVGFYGNTEVWQQKIALSGTKPAHNPCLSDRVNKP